MSEVIGITGAGLIGRAWAIVFARAGFAVRLHDVAAGALADARDRMRASCADLQAAGLLDDPDAVLDRVRIEPELAAAVADCAYVQECGPESEAAKRAIFAELDRLAPAGAILASSTSGIAASRFIDGLRHPGRCLVAHPVNPPSLVPLVEVVPAPQTDEASTGRAIDLLRRSGQAPIRVRRETAGFVLNRLQGALLNEALRLVADDVVSVEDLDATVKHGLGLRWSFMGPFETIDLNAPGGLIDYGQRYGPLYDSIRPEGAEPPLWSAERLAAVERQRRQRLPADRLAGRQAWRDRRLMALVRHKRESDRTLGE